MTQSGDLDRDRMALQSFLLGRPGGEASLAAQIRKVARQLFRSLADDPLEDIVQAVFLKLCVQVSKPGFQLHSSLNGLLRALTRATCVDWYRRERRRALVELRLGELRAALARHEDERRDDHALLGRIEAELARLTARFDDRP